MRTVSIIGGGWSLSELGEAGRDLIPGFRVGVNDAFLLMRCDVGVTMDRLWLEHRIDRAIAQGKTLWARRTAMVNIRQHTPLVRRFECDHETGELADKTGWLNGPNSGHCALNLAYKMRPERIVLWGFDMNRSPAGSPYWYPAYPWAKVTGTPPVTYASWAVTMEVARVQCQRRGIQLLNASLTSAVAGIEKIEPRSLLECPST